MVRRATFWFDRMSRSALPLATPACRKTTEAWRNLWFHTGDRVRARRRRLVSISGRRDAVEVGEEHRRLRVRGGSGASGDKEVGRCLPVPSSCRTNDVAVVCEDGVELDLARSIFATAEPRLAYFAIPRFVDIVAELPMTENGKIRKMVLRERGITDSTWDREAAGYQLSRLPRSSAG